MSTIITSWGWFQMGRLTQYKVKVNIETFLSFMQTVDETHKAEIQWYNGAKVNQRIIVIQQLNNWTGWDNIKHSMEIAKANVIVQKGLTKLSQLTEPKIAHQSSDYRPGDYLPF